MDNRYNLEGRFNLKDFKSKPNLYIQLDTVEDLILVDGDREIVLDKEKIKDFLKQFEKDR